MGSPLNPAGKPSKARAEHLSEVKCPVLCLPGTRDAWAKLDLVREVAADLGESATPNIVDDADHSFHVRASIGQTDKQVRVAMAGGMVEWFVRIASTSGERSGSTP